MATTTETKTYGTQPVVGQNTGYSEHPVSQSVSPHQTGYGELPSSQQLHEMPAQTHQQSPMGIQQDPSPPSYPGPPPGEKHVPQAPYGPDQVGSPQPPQQAHGGMVYSNQPQRMVVPLDQLSSECSQDIDCPFCKKLTRTRVQQEHSSMTFLIGVLLGLCCICLACVPCLAHWAQDVDWYCSSCNKRVATRPNGGQTQPCATPENRYVQSQYNGGAPPHDGGVQHQQQHQQQQYK